MKRDIGILAAMALGIVIGVLWPGRCESASGSTELVIYTALETDELAVYQKEWEKIHPEIKLKIVRDSTGIMTAKLLAERDNPQADVVWGLAATSLLECGQAGMLQGYNPAGIERVRETFKDSKHDLANWVGIKAWQVGFTCNTIECKKLGLAYPTSYDDLIKPEYKDRLVMPNPASSGTGFLFVSGILQIKGEDKGWEYLDRLNENIAIYTHSGSQPSKLAGKGECPIGISFAYRALQQKADGEPVVLSLPKEGSGWDIEANALIRKSHIKGEAKVFLDWAISDDAMAMYHVYFPTTSVDVKGAQKLEGWPADPMKQLIKNDFEWAAKNRARILKEWSRRYEGGKVTK